MLFKIDQKILESFSSSDLKVFFFKSGCEGTKIDITDEFDTSWLESIEIWGKNIYFSLEDGHKLEWGNIVPKTSSVEWHGWKAKYLFVSPKVESRCGCATSFSFERKLIAKDKLSKLKAAFWK